MPVRRRKDPDRLNIKDTRLTDPRKRALLMALVALAIARAGRAAAALLGNGAPKCKSRGYLAQSWFRIGFGRIRNLLASQPEAAIAAGRTIRKPTSNQLAKPGGV